jgi:hypothetical protein
MGYGYDAPPVLSVPEQNEWRSLIQGENQPRYGAACPQPHSITQGYRYIKPLVLSLPEKMNAFLIQGEIQPRYGAAYP